MNDQELDAAIDGHYLGEAWTLTSGAEANLLKLAELRDRLTPEKAARWTVVKAAYLRDKALGGAEDDPMVWRPWKQRSPAPASGLVNNLLVHRSWKNPANGFNITQVPTDKVRESKS